MQIGVNLWVWESMLSDDQVEHRVAQAARMGFDVVEFPIEEPESFDYERAADCLADHGLDASVVVAMTDQRDMLHEDPDRRANGREYVRDCVDAAAALGADRVVGPLYSAVGRTWRMSPGERAEAVDLLVGQLADLAAYADEHSVRLCVEPINRFETSFLNTTEQALGVIERVDHPACTLLLDTFHANIEESSLPAAIRAAGEQLGHVHACGNDRGAPGNGHIPWDDIADALADVGYDDQVVVESFTPEVESIARAAAIWRPLEPSQDALAGEGLAFLEDLFAQV